MNRINPLAMMGLVASLFTVNAGAGMGSDVLRLLPAPGSRSYGFHRCNQRKLRKRHRQLRSSGRRIKT